MDLLAVEAAIDFAPASGLLVTCCGAFRLGYNEALWEGSYGGSVGTISVCDEVSGLSCGFYRARKEVIGVGVVLAWRREMGIGRGMTTKTSIIFVLWAFFFHDGPGFGGGGGGKGVCEIPNHLIFYNAKTPLLQLLLLWYSWSAGEM